MAIAGGLNDKEWTDIVRRRLGDAPEIKVLAVKLGKISDNMLGFLGEHLQAEVTFVRGKCDQEHLKFFIKKFPTNASFHTDFILSTNAFQKEAGLYSEVFEQYRKYGLIAERKTDAIHGTPSKLHPWAPVCYYTRPDLMVQENLVDYNFRTCDNHKYMDYAHCELVLQTLANFHACSIMFEEVKTKETGERYTLNNKYPHLLCENVFQRGGKSQLIKWFHSSLKAILALINVLPKYRKGTKYHDEIVDKIQDKWETIIEYVKPSPKYRNVLCHGDLWTNNLLFQYKKDNVTPEDVCFVDFQLNRYAPPAVDVLMFMHLTTSRAFRATHLGSLLRSYHVSLSRELLRHGGDPDRLLSWADFDASCRHYSGAGRIVAPAYHQINLMPDGVLKEQLGSSDTYETFLQKDRDEIVVQCFVDQAGYRARLTEDIEDFLECFVLEIKTV